jgi:alkylhydroperoxidase family enzyme
MASPTYSERRKARDAALRTQDEMIAERIAEAQRSGELQSAPSYGRPMPEAEGWHETPAELRMPFKILKNAGVAPPEIELLHRRAALRRAVAECASEEERATLRQRLNELEQLIAFRLERLRVTGRL